MNQWKRQVFAGVITGMVLCSAGCGMQQNDQTADIRKVTTGAALYVDENNDSEAVQHQLEVLVENAPKWRMAGDADTTKADVVYTVTDLDHNGRIEIIAFQDKEWDDAFSVQRYFEVNSAGDGIEAIEFNQIKDVFLGDMETLDTAYYDPETGECHYVMGNELAAEEMLSEDSNDYRNIIALTLNKGQITSDTLAYQMQSEQTKPRFYRVDGTEKNEIDESQYSVGELGDVVYSKCEKFTVSLSTFSFDHSLEDMTETQMHYALEKSYRECLMGYPLGQQKIKIAGQKILIPQYTMMQDQQKQKRINRLIVKKVEQTVNQTCDPQDPECDWNVDITIKYAGRDKVSLLLKANGYRKGTAERDTFLDTVNIDLEQEKILSGFDFLPESCRECAKEYIRDFVMELIEIEEEEETEEEHQSNDIDRNVIEYLENWQEIKLYQTLNMIGVVIPTGLRTNPYVIQEVWNEWEDPDSGVSYAEIDWGAYQYKMLASEYQSLQDYMPVLNGETEFTLMEETWAEDDATEMERRNLTISDWVREYKDSEYMNCGRSVVERISICDLTQDGKMELILDFYGDFFLILHREGDSYYGMYYDAGYSFWGLQRNGVYGRGKYDFNLFQMRFEKDTFVEYFIGGSESGRGNLEKDVKVKYYIQDKEVKEEVWEKWYKSITDEYVCWYTPDARDKR